MTKRQILTVFLLAATLAGCATQTSNPAAEAPGFLYGLLHGFISLFTLIGGFFTDWEVYNFPNNGWPYDLGFVLGAMMFYGGGASARG